MVGAGLGHVVVGVGVVQAVVSMDHRSPPHQEAAVAAHMVVRAMAGVDHSPLHQEAAVAAHMVVQAMADDHSPPHQEAATAAWNGVAADAHHVTQREQLVVSHELSGPIAS